MVLRKRKAVTLVIAIAIMMVLSIMGWTVVNFSTADLRASSRILDSERVSILLKRPTQINIKAKPGLSQPLLATYDIELDITIDFRKSIEEKYGFIDIVGMSVGRSTVSGSIFWNDEEGDHNIELDGICTMWTMRH